MLNKSSLNLSGRETVARDVNNVIHTASDPVVAVVIATSAISSELGNCQLLSLETCYRWLT